MKKLIQIGFFLTLLPWVSSCNKTYNCRCYTSGKDYVMSSNSKAGATTECENYEADVFNGNCQLTN